MSDPYRMVVEDLTETICRFRPDGTFIYANEVYCRLFGRGREEVEGSSWQPVVVAEDLPRVEARLRQLTPDNPVVVVENRVLDHSGAVRWMQFINRGFFNAQGQLTEIQSVGRDVSERVFAELQSRENRARWHFALESSGLGVWDWDIENGSVYYSPEWKRLLGYNEHDEVPGGEAGWHAVLHSDDLAGTISAINDHLEGRTERYAGEFRARCKGGSWKWVRARGKVTSFQSDGKPRCMIGTVSDISLRKAEEEREARNLQMIAEGAPCAAVLEAIVRSVEASHPAMRCTVMLVDPSGTMLRVGTAPSMPEYVRKALDRLPVEPGGSCCGECAHTGRRVICQDVLFNASMESFHRLAVRARIRGVWSEPVLSAAGQVLGTLACYHKSPHVPDHSEIQDIAAAARLAGMAIERERQENALRLSEERYARAIQGTTDGLWDWDVVTGEVYLSPRWKEMLGFAEHELPNHRDVAFLSRLHPDDAPKVMAMRHAHFKDRIPYEVEFRLLTKAGDYKWFVARGRAVWNEQGEPVRMAGTISDITARKQAESNYRRELAYNQALVSNTAAFIVVLDAQGRFVHGNPAFFETMGYPEVEVIGKTPWELGLMDAGETVRSKERFARLLKGSDNPATDTRLRTRSGKWRTVELRSTTTRKSDGSPDRIIVTGMDVTERYELQQEILKIAEQEQARLGHDLHDGVGQTMTGLIIMVEALEAELKGESQVLAHRIHELMKESVAEVRRMSHGLSPTSVKYRGLVGALQLLAETVRTNFRTPCTADIDESIAVTDSETQNHLFRIAQEAVNNALRHGKPKNITLSLQRVSPEECELRVSDDGVGMKKTKKPESNGIGVRVMAYRANLMGARLLIETKPRRGVVVTCRFSCSLSPKRKKKADVR